jgi:hypothetical protein
MGKVCVTCGVEKPLGTFGKDNRRVCRACRGAAYKSGAFEPDPVAARAFIVSRIELADLGPFGPCWIWQRHTEEKGYARGHVTGYSRANVHVHRAAYELFVRPIPPGLHIDHLCCVTSCVNPSHLEAVTPEENWRRQYARTRELKAAARENQRGEGCNGGQRPGVAQCHIAHDNRATIR